MITADLREFKKALQLVRTATRKDEAEIVNSALKDIAFRSASFTPKTTASEVRAELHAGGLLAKLAAISLNKSRGPKRWTRKQHRAEMRKISAARRKSVNAVRAGWIPAIEALGGTFRGGKVKPGGSASKGKAKKATIKSVAGFVENTVITTDHRGRARSAEQIQPATVALQKAVRYVTKDRTKYALKKINQTLKKHSDR